jgi:hypothetical protein
MKSKLLAAALAIGVLSVGVSHGANASHIISPGTVIDSIDYAFTPGGGTFDGTLSPSGSWDWFTFEATAGDTIAIETLGILGSFDTGLSLVEDFSGNTLVEAGDAYSPGTLNLLAGDDDSGSGNLSLINFNISTTGAYGIALGGYVRRAGHYRLSLSGNTTTIPTSIPPVVHAVPEPAAIGLFGLGLVGLGFARRRKVA